MRGAGVVREWCDVRVPCARTVYRVWVRCGLATRVSVPVYFALGQGTDFIIYGSGGPKEKRAAMAAVFELFAIVFIMNKPTVPLLVLLIV